MSAVRSDALAGAIPGGIRLRLKVRPNARQNRVVGIAADAEGGTALKLNVTAVPEDGKANAAVAVFLAEALGVAKSAVSVVQGATDRRKLVEIRGDAPALMAALEGLLQGLDAKGKSDHE